MFRNMRDFLKDESGATFMEYGIIAGLVSLVVITALRTLSVTLTDMLAFLQATLDGIFS
ncbi:Flp family type IVb pilin [uncultured Cohaesibacter sp.]|uniref:Flp family type IVb pilin n=1 Tax=uncultured Cohaesibacter sp. TaxID=1002546 RepID=UPI0029C85BBD|nr:Flp family type IVb pilin [uncultured Cohaesibacter sp.]